MRHILSWIGMLGAVLLLQYGALPANAQPVTPCPPISCPSDNVRCTFELDTDSDGTPDGNAVDDPACPGEDWNKVFSNPSTTTARDRVFIKVTAQNRLRFTGGSKDYNDMEGGLVFCSGQAAIGGNVWDTKSSPDKGDVTNAYAALYPNGVLALGADLFGSTGTTFLGMHFFQSPIALVPGSPKNTFSGHRTVGDLFILFNLEKGGNSVTILVYEWNPCATSDPTFDHNYTLVTAPASLAFAVTNNINAADDCNNGVLPCAPWCYDYKSSCPCPAACAAQQFPIKFLDNDPGKPLFDLTGSCTSADNSACFPARTFFEGAVNLRALGLSECFQNMLVETRAAAAITAELKAFELAEFVTSPRCRVEPTSASVCDGSSREFCVFPYNSTGPYHVVIKDSSGNVVKDCPDVADGDSCCISVSEADTYTSTVTDSLNCTSTNCPFTLTISPKPTCSVTPSEVCLGGELCATPSGGTAPYTVVWKNAAGTTIKTCTNVAANGTCCVTPTAAGVYTAEITDSNGCTCTTCCSGTVNAPPTCTVTPAAVCLGDPLCGKATGGAPPYTLVWKNSAGTVVQTCNNVAENTCCNFTATATGTYTLTATDSKQCTCQSSGTVNPNPACSLGTSATIVTPMTSPPSATLTGTVTTPTTEPYTCSASVVGQGWAVSSCSVSGLTITVTFTVTQPAAANGAFTVTLTDANSCSSTCTQTIGIPANCLAPVPQEVCPGTEAHLCASVVTGTAGSTNTLDWYGPFGPVDIGQTPTACGDVAALVASGKLLKTCTGLQTGGTTCSSGVNGCQIDVTQTTPGIYTYCAVVTNGMGFASVPCQAVLQVNPNPVCAVTPSSVSVCNGDLQQFAGTASGGKAPYTAKWKDSQGTVLQTCTLLLGGAQDPCYLFTDQPGTYTFSVTDDNGCVSDDCTVTLEVGPCLCRVTGGGNDLSSPWPWDGTFAQGVQKKNSGQDFYTFGGQAGAPTAAQPQPYGEWTHRQHNGPDGSFTFHGGTASAPPETKILEIRCHDNGYCSPARPAPSKQVNFKGIGQFKNIFGNAPVKAQWGAQVGKSLHYFTVHIEDAGEPGNKAEPGAVCPDAGSDTGTVDCDCADFYQIVIHQTTDPASPVIYGVRSYLKGGNLQIHPPIDK